MFQILEHPNEVEVLQFLRDVAVEERKNFTNLIYDLISNLEEQNLEEQDLEILHQYANGENSTCAKVHKNY